MLSAILKNISCNISRTKWATSKNEMSFSTNFSMINPLEWLLLSLGVTVTFKSKMTTLHLKQNNTCWMGYKCKWGFFHCKPAVAIADNDDFKSDTLTQAGHPHCTNVMYVINAIHKRFKGISDVLVAAGIIAEGSVDLALGGKHFKSGVHCLQLFYETLIHHALDMQLENCSTLRKLKPPLRSSASRYMHRMRN